ncbi:uncharacterized protein LOC111375666 [Olea europaea var. sylvestris]|uniref:uncharacterized protein LOC111375666 n=1 Tax=Olea europaea var. sylvestris TaxID=158386 RepID=UPI000C1CD1D7|nr:uncharacterized protein LOC111375666 [Olea europaea var. sylvestris]
MTFDPSALRQAVTKKSKAPQTRAPGQKRGKKRAREKENIRSGPGETSARGHTPTTQATKTPTGPPRSHPRPRSTPEVVDLEDEIRPMPSFQNQEPDWCPLVSSIVDKYRKDLGFDEGMKALESLTLKALSIARGLSLKGKDESQKTTELEDSSRALEKRIADLEAERFLLLKELEDSKNDAHRAREEAGTAKGEAEGLKLEIERLKVDFEARLAEARGVAIEDFKTSEEFNGLKGEYAMGSYFHAFKEARAFLRSRPDANPEDLKNIPEIADTLELSESEEIVEDQEVDVDGEDAVEEQGSTASGERAEDLD